MLILRLFFFTVVRPFGSNCIFVFSKCNLCRFIHILLLLLLFSSASCEYKWMYYKCDHKCLHKVITNNPSKRKNHTENCSKNCIGIANAYGLEVIFICRLQE